jgi:hypothetical protein
MNQRRRRFSKEWIRELPLIPQKEWPQRGAKGTRTKQIHSVQRLVFASPGG